MRGAARADRGSRRRDGPGVEARGGEDAGGDRRAGAALADRDDRPVGGQLGRRRSDQAVGNVPAPGQRRLLALVGLAYVDQLARRRREARPARRPRPARCGPRSRADEDVARGARGTRPSGGRGPPRAASSAEDACRTSGSSAGTTNPVFVAKLAPETGTLIAPADVTGEEALRRPHVEDGWRRRARPARRPAAARRGTGRG